MAKNPEKKNRRSAPLALVLAVLFLALFYVTVVLRGSATVEYGPTDAPAVTVGLPAIPLSPGEAAPGLEPGSASAPSTEGAADLRLSEIVVKNHTAWRAPDGSFPDWIEIYNADSDPVKLEGWKLTDGSDVVWSFPRRTLEPGEYLIVCADGSGRVTEDMLCASFSLSPGETVKLLGPGGGVVDKMACFADTANHSVALGEDGEVFESKDPTPGLPNTTKSVETYAASLDAEGPLCINEVVVANFSGLDIYGRYYDWVELKNVSRAAVQLSDYYLSDDADEPKLWRLPQRMLEPGETYLVFCSGDESLSSGSNLHTNFSLDSADEDLFLVDSRGVAVDYVYLRNVPTDGSMGRQSGQHGWYYFLTPTPRAENSGGYRRVSAKPVAAEPDGVFEDVDEVTVELSSPGTIYYSFGNRLPDTSSSVYTGPITISETCVLRAIAVESGCAPSRVLTLSYVVNEGHTLPVLSLVTDYLGAFRNIYNNGIKYVKTPASLSFYEPEGSFTIACGLSMKGWTSLELEKKSFGVSFGGYGDGDLRYDPFGIGIDRYSSLCIRAGQTYMSSFINDELFQDLCAEASDHVPTQAGRYCVLYVNGNYWGIYCLKEDLTRQFYASHAGVSKSSVEKLKSSVSNESSIYREIMTFCVRNDMSKQENYEHFCAMFDVDNLIDWLILEAYSANSDVNGNMRYFRSYEGDGRWQIAYYDLDWSFRVPNNCFNNVINPERVVQIEHTVKALLKNTEFKMKLAKRCVELCSGVLSNEHVLQKIDEYQDLLDPEMAREHERWGGSVRHFHDGLDGLRAFVISNDWENFMVNRLFYILRLTDEQKAEVLGQTG